MSVRPETMPWLTKNRAAGSTDSTPPSAPRAPGGLPMVPRHDPYDRRVVIAIDVGNSAVKVARMAGGEVVEVTRLATAAGPDRDAIGRLLGTDDEAIAMVSVVPGWSTAIEEMAARR